MGVTKEQLDRFHEFAVSLVSGGQSDLTWRRLLELWHLENSSVDEHGENVAAIQQALDAMEAGRMHPFADFDSDFRGRHGITDEA